MDEEENPRGGTREEAGNSTSDDIVADADPGAPSTDASDGDTPADGASTADDEDDVSPEDIDIQASIGPDADAPDGDLDQHKDPDVGLDKVVLNDDEGSKGLFDDLLAGEPIFENKEVLRPSYTPHELPHRTDQINQMATILVSALRGETPSNILIYGKTGTGKTASAKFVSQELESTSQKYDVPCEVEYINCEVTDTQYRVLAQLANKFIEKNVERIEAEQERLDEMRTRATEDPNALADTPYDSIAEIDERAAELDDDARRRLASRVALDATEDAAPRAVGALGGVLRPHVTPNGPFETAEGYADVLDCLAASEPGLASALALGVADRPTALDAWREHASATHAALRTTDPARYSGFVVAETDAPAWPLARLLRDTRTDEPAVLVVGGGDAALATTSDGPDARATLADAFGDDAVAGASTHARTPETDVEALTEGVREVLSE
mgnify:CR=1 FL=1